ncbi:MAG: hypothetical protein B7X99_03970 [Rhizobiales bacterium 17-65-6]|nr:MAG: hypothetical protein B7Z30_10535 [Rhizobiales bacterium 12-68-15]OYX89215.1 MAG: hypothetical protein B7Y84_06055 [Azorhizobium sp. 32-67-21]OZA00468.1 MAG: hypothetical protein B7X99_03970 [Rhizobiales bacterium 17-65-6]
MKFAAALLAASLFAAPAFAQDAPPNIVGTWKGDSDGLSEKYGWVTGPVTLTVTEQKGRAFRASLIYPSEKGGSKTESVVGAFAADGKNIFLASDDGIHIAVLQGDVVDACYLEPGDNDGLALCARLKKQP